MANGESTAEQIENYLAALAVEKTGYERRLAVAKAKGAERLSVADLEARIKGVDAEAKRAKSLLGKAEKAEAEPEPVEEEAAAA